jgi:hypothetical protein
VYSGPSRGPCVGIIYTHPSRVGGIQELFSPIISIVVVPPITFFPARYVDVICYIKKIVKSNTLVMQPKIPLMTFLLTLLRTNNMK